MKKIFIIGSIVIFLIIVLLFFIFKNKNDDTITLFGNIEIRTVDLSFQVSGVIKEIYKEEGDYVKTGDLLAILDDRDYRANYNKALEEKNSSLAQNKEDNSKYERNLPLCKDGTISKQECITLLNKKTIGYYYFRLSLLFLYMYQLF